jgi:hypothetical protein
VAIILHGAFFVILLFGLSLEMRAAGPSATAAIPITLTVSFALVLVVTSISITYSILRRRGRRRTVAQLNPGALIVSAVWNGGVSLPFLRPGPAKNATNFRAVGVEIVADERGIAIWRGGTRAVDLGLLPWSKIVSITSEPRRLISAKQSGRFLVINVLSGDTPYADRLEFMADGTEGAVAEISSKRPLA